MKNKLIILVIAAFAIVLGACGNKQEVTYENDNGFSITEMTYIAKEDQVIRRIAKNTVDYQNIGVTTKSEAEEYIKEAEEADSDLKNFRKKDGVSYRVTFHKDYLVEEVEIDTRKVDHETLSVIHGGNLNPGDNYISLKRSIELLEEEGFTKKE